MTIETPEYERLWSFAFRVVVAYHLKTHAGMNRPDFGDCQERFCREWREEWSRIEPEPKR